MKTINTKNNNVITCDCGNVIEFDKTDYILQKTDESGMFYAIGVKCPVCGCLHVKNPEDFDGNALLSTLKGGKKNLSDCSWDEIKEAVAAYYNGGEIPFAVGEKKEIRLKDNSSAFIAFLGKEYGYEEEFKERAPLVFGFFDLVGTDDNGGAQMNEEYTNKGGWEACKMRKYLNEDFINLLPNELVSLIKVIKKKTANKGRKVSVTEDKIFLPSEVEVFGKVKYSAEGEGYQYDFFKNWHNRVKGYSDGCYGRWWLLRSPYSGGSTYFCIVNSDGGYYYNYANYTYGVSPCFAL